jgi:hypothetical protein
MVSYTTTWSTYVQYGTSWASNVSYTTSWGSWVAYNTYWYTYVQYYTYWEASRNTDDGQGDPNCIVEGTLVNISTSVSIPVESLLKDAPVLTMDGGFNIDNTVELTSISTTSVIGNLSSDDMVSGIRKINVIGIVDINNGLLKTTGDHMHIVKRDGKWHARQAATLLPGDMLQHINGSEIEITSAFYDDVTPYVVYKLDIEPNDTFFANVILTHNKKLPLCREGGSEICDKWSMCYNPCDPNAYYWGCEWECYDQV